MSTQIESSVVVKEQGSLAHKIIIVTDCENPIQEPPDHLFGLPLYYSDGFALGQKTEALKSFKKGEVPLSDCLFFHNLKDLAESARREILLHTITIGPEGRQLIETYASNAKRIVTLAALYCVSRGLNFELRGSELDALLLDDPNRITGARRNIKVDELRIMDSQETRNHPFRLIEFEKPPDAKMRFDYPGQGGIDFKVKTSDESMVQNLFNFLRENTVLADPLPVGYVVPDVGYDAEIYTLRERHQLQEVFNVSPIPEYPSMQTINHQLIVDQLAVRNGALVTQPYVLASLNISGEDDHDRRRADRCFNLDALRGTVVLRDSKSNLVTAETANVADFDKITSHVQLPIVPQKAAFPEKAYMYFFDQIGQGNLSEVMGCIEVIIRGMRKALTYGVPIDNASVAVCDGLVEKTRRFWPPQSNEYLAKNSNEMKICAEFDSYSTLLYLHFLGLYRLIPVLNDGQWFNDNFHIILHYYEELSKIYRIKITSAHCTSITIPNYVMLSAAIRKARYPNENPMENTETTLRLF